ncbi:MAG: hypothetical protein QXH80_01380, partial [Candidatus Nanoarchaeia archaeon]
MIWHVSVLVAVAIVLASFAYSFLSALEITGFGTVSQPTYEQNLHLTATENQEYKIELKYFPENASMTSFGLMGSIIGDGKVKVYLISDDKRLLVLDSDEVKEESAGITGFSTAEDSDSSSSSEGSSDTGGDSAEPGPPSSSDSDADTGSDTEPSGPGAETPEETPAEEPSQEPEPEYPVEVP